MNKLFSDKGLSFLRSLIYLSAFLVSVFVVYSFAGKMGDDPYESKPSFRVMTYNIHHGEGMDGVVDLDRIARVINKENPDILMLQEVDVQMDRSGRIDIPRYISEAVGLKYVVFGKNLEIDGGEYGNATISRFPIRRSKNIHFEQIGPEQRGVLAAEITVNGQNLLVLNSHFDHSSDDSERILYTEKIISEVLPEYKPETVLFGGDFNDIPTSPMYQMLIEEFKDVWAISGQGEGFTIPADQPERRIDYLLFKGNIKPDSVWVPKTEASDHLPVAADFFWLINNNFPL